MVHGVVHRVNSFRKKPPQHIFLKAYEPVVFLIPESWLPPDYNLLGARHGNLYLIFFLRPGQRVTRIFFYLVTPFVEGVFGNRMEILYRQASACGKVNCLFCVHLVSKE